MKNKIKWIRVMSFKHDGSLHRIWDKAALILEDEEKIVISNSKTLVREENGRMWMAKEPSVCTFYKKRWFNIMGFIRNGGVNYYCNMASPCVVEKNVVKYIDYDLDLVKNVHSQIKILDENEYALNKEKYNYGADIEKILNEELKLLKQSALNNELAFKNEQIYSAHKAFVGKLKRKKDDTEITN